MQNQQTPQYSVFVGKNSKTGGRERHLLHYIGPDDVLHAWSAESEEKSEHLKYSEAVDAVAALMLSGFKPRPLVRQRSWWQEFFTELELVFRTHSSLIYFAGLTAASCFYLVRLGLSEWYEWVGFVVALLLGALMSKAAKVSFLGFNIETEQWSGAILYQNAILRATQQWANVSPQPDSGPSAAGSPPDA